jgi:di/tripeptidase
MVISSKDILNEVGKAIKSSSGYFRTEIVYKTEPHLVKDTALIKTFLKTSKRMKLKMETITLAGNSVAKEFNEGGIPAITHYPMNHLPIHEPNEYIEISKMEKVTNLYFEFLKDYFEVK